jgi:hypothetical protein
MRLAVVDDGGRPHEVDGEAAFAERLAPELMASEPAPTAMIVGASAVVTTLSAAAGVETGEGIGAHEAR